MADPRQETLTDRSQLHNIQFLKSIVHEYVSLIHLSEIKLHRFPRFVKLRTVAGYRVCKLDVFYANIVFHKHTETNKCHLGRY